MRNLKFAILGLINRKSMTGYDIKKAFDERALINFWHAEHSQIYPELKKLVDEGMIEYSTEIKGEKLETKLYNITESGRKEFNSWLKTDAEIERTYKDIFRLRTFFSESLSNEDYLLLLNSQLKQHTDKKSYLTNTMNNVFKSKPPQKGSAELGDYMVLDSAILRENSYIEWLNHCINIYK